MYIPIWAQLARRQSVCASTGRKKGFTQQITAIVQNALLAAILKIAHADIAVAILTAKRRQKHEPQMEELKSKDRRFEFNRSRSQ